MRDGPGIQIQKWLVWTEGLLSRKIFGLPAEEESAGRGFLSLRHTILCLERCRPCLLQRGHLSIRGDENHPARDRPRLVQPNSKRISDTSLLTRCSI
jgi:hypothetical protein